MALERQGNMEYITSFHKETLEQKQLSIHVETQFIIYPNSHRVFPPPKQTNPNMAASVSGILTLVIVIIVAPLAAYLYNRFLHQCVKARCVHAKRLMSENELVRRFNVNGARRRLSRFSRRASSGENGKFQFA